MVTARSLSSFMAAIGSRWTVRSFSHLAGGLNAHGIGVAIPSYDLCPSVSVDDIIQQMRAASRELARLGRSLVISGHSAGGHLAACMLATDWPAFDASLPEDLVVAAYAISGLFDLRPLVETSINKALRLDARSRPGREPVVLEVPLRGKSRCGGRRKRKRGIFPAKQDHRRPLGRGRRHDTVRSSCRMPTILPRLRRSPIQSSPMVLRLKELAGR